MAEAKSLDFLENAGDSGFENMGVSEISTPLLLISQALSKNVAEGTISVGHFYNSITGKDYGSEVRVVVCHFDKMWYEWKPNQGGLAGRYPVGGLEGVVGDRYTGMKHGENKIEEKYVYLVYLPDFPEDGFLVFASTGGNMKYLKGWNTQLSYLRTPGGKQAPIYAGIWKMSLGKDQNKQGQPYYSCNKDGKSSIVFDEWVSKEAFDKYILPARETASQAIAIADMRSSDSDTETVAETGDF